LPLKFELDDRDINWLEAGIMTNVWSDNWAHK